MTVSVNPMAFFGSPYEEEYAGLLAAGATHIGLAAQKLRSLGWDEGVERALGAGLTVDYLVVGLMEPPSRWDGLLERAIDGAAAVGARCVYFCSGPPETATYEEAADALVEGVRPLVPIAAQAGVTLCLENTLSSRSDCSFVFSVADALAVAERAGASLCVDLYCCWVEPGLQVTLQRAGTRLGMVQVSDRCLTSLAQPDRRVPGDGDLPLASLMAEVRAAGYQGTFDLELLGPQIEREGPASAVRRGLRWLEDQCTE